MNAIGAIRPSSPLFASPEMRVHWDDYLTVALGQSVQRVQEGPVNPDLNLEGFRQELDSFDFMQPRPLAEMLPWVITQMEHGNVHQTHPRYFGLFNPSPTFPAECAERIVGAFNPQLASSTTSPVAVEIEAHVIRAVAQRIGFPSGAGGHFTSGGSEANGTALVCALTRANPRFGQDGIRAFAGAPILYVSEDSHLAWYKIAHQSGIGRSSIRLIATDPAGRMDPEVLAATIAADRASGCIPVMIAATAGTTAAGMIDPILDCAAVARDAGTWFHVDAAWGGAIVASDRLRVLLAGIEIADSATIDAHKWFATTMACGMFLVRDPAILADSFHVAASFMPSNVAHLDPYMTTAQWSRRFIGLRLFLSLAVAGWRGYGEHVEHSIELAGLLRQELISTGWSAANDSPLAVLCVDPPPGFASASSIARGLVDSGQAWVSSTKFRGRDVVRMCVTNGQTTSSDIMALIRSLQAFGPSDAV